MIRFILSIILLLSALPAQTVSGTCRSTLAADAQQVATELSALASQANAQGFQTAVQELAKQLKALLPTLSAPDQKLVEKFLTDLSAATAETGPGGQNITATEKLTLSKDLTDILVSTGMTNSDISTLLNNVQSVFASLQGLNTDALRAALTKTAQDAKACRIR